jgi:hypothetical protein
MSGHLLCLDLATTRVAAILFWRANSISTVTLADCTLCVIVHGLKEGVGIQQLDGLHRQWCGVCRQWQSVKNVKAGMQIAGRFVMSGYSICLIRVYTFKLFER